MGNGKNTYDELRKIAGDEGVPMKTKVSLLSAVQADTFEAVSEMTGKLDKFVDDMNLRMQAVETKSGNNLDEIEKLRKRSDRNDWISTIATMLAALGAALAAAFGINK